MMRTGTHGERFGQLRSLLHQAPTRAAWDELAVLLLTWDDGALRDEILPYVRGFMAQWGEVARFHPSWWAAMEEREEVGFCTLATEVVLGWDQDALALLGAVQRAGLRWPTLRTFRCRAQSWLDPSWVFTGLARLDVSDMLALEVLGWDGTLAAVEGALHTLRPRLLSLPRWQSGADDVESLFVPGAFPWLRALDLSRNMLSLSPEWAERVATRGTSPLRAITLNHGIHRDIIPLTLAHTDAFAGVLHLDLSDNLIEAEGVEALGAGPMRLASFELGDNYPDEPQRVLDALADLPAFRGLERLGLRCSHLDDDEPLDTIHRAPWVHTMRALDLSHNDLSVHDLRLLMEQPWRHLTTLDLSQCFPTDATRALLTTEAPRWPDTLRSLDLTSVEHARLTADQLRHAKLPPALEQLDLRGVLDAQEGASLQESWTTTHPALRVLAGPFEEPGARYLDEAVWPYSLEPARAFVAEQG